MTQNAMTPNVGKLPPYRVGGDVGRTIYRIVDSINRKDDEIIGLIDTRELAAAVVAGLNRPDCGCWQCPECGEVHPRRPRSL